MADSSDTTTTPPTTKSVSHVLDHSAPAFAEGAVAEIPKINPLINSLQVQNTGLYATANDLQLYIFDGTAEKVETIYTNFNESRIIKAEAADDGLTLAWKACKFNSRIKIVPDKLLFNGKMVYTTENLDKLTKSGLFGAIRNGAEGLMNISNVISGIGSIFDKKEEGDTRSQGQKFNEQMESAQKAGQGGGTEFPLYINKYKNIPYYTDYNMEALTSLSLKFNFGQSRLFSGLEEVVKPIVGLISAFNISESAGPDFFTANGIMPNKTQALTAMYSSLFTGSFSSSSSVGSQFVIKDSSGNRVGGTFSSQSAAETARAGITGSYVGLHVEAETEANQVSGIFENLAKGFANAISSAAKANKVKGIFIRIGNYIAGPFTPTTIEWNFDFNRIDEYGFPCYGDLTFNGLKMIDMNPSFIKKSWGLGE